MADELQKTSNESEYGATVIIRHKILDGQQTVYESWLEEIGAKCQSQPGHLDTQIIRPIAGCTSAYAVILRFSTKDYADAWMQSQARAQLIRKARPMLQTEDDYSVHSGIEFLFAAAAPSQPDMPTRWKQFLVTWSAIYPLVLLVPMAFDPLLRAMGLHDNRYVATLVVTGAVVALMVYLVMPKYTKMVQNWLFR